MEHARRCGSRRLGACYNKKFTCQGRSSVVEQRPFKPKVVGSIPTAPTNHPCDWQALSKSARGQNKLGDSVRAFIVGGTSDNRIHESHSSDLGCVGNHKAST